MNRVGPRLPDGRRLPFGMSRDVGILTAANFIWGLGEGLFIFFYPLALQRWNINSVQIGVVLSFLGVFMALAQAPAGYLSDRFGPRLLIRAAMILGVVAAIMMAVAESLPFFIAGLVAYSITSFIAAPINSYITHMRGSWSVQRGLSFVAGSFQAGEIVGPMVGGWIAQTAGLGVVFQYSTGLFLIATTIVFFARRAVVQPDAQESGPARANPLANPRFLGLLVIIFLTIIALSAPQQLTSVYLQEVHHLSLQQIGLTGTFAGIGGALILFAVGSVSPLAGMVAGQALLGLFCLFLWRGQNAAVFYIGYLFASGYRLYRSMASAAVRPLVKACNVGLAYGLVELANALAVILAPLVAGLLYHAQPASVYTISLIALIVTILLTVWYSSCIKPS
jgi:MFS transporter, FSR family, fosmidomycin resistance protein